MKNLKEELKAYMDLTRIHFAIVWPLLFCSGLIIAFENYGGFTWELLAKGFLIGLFGFEAGMVLNDIVDREIDKKEVEDKLTKYWRPFKERPLSSGKIPAKNAYALFFAFTATAAILASTLPDPNSLYLILLGVVCYSLEVFYQVKKRNQGFPFAQLLGRIDFTLFPVAGYLTVGRPDATALLYALFFYPFAQAHLGINDLADYENDKARGMKTVPVFYGKKGTVRWITFFSVLHVFFAAVFLTSLGFLTVFGMLAGLVLLAIANQVIIGGKDEKSALKALPFFHATLFVYMVFIFAEFLPRFIA